MEDEKLDGYFELSQLCGKVRALVKDRNYEECTRLIREAMRDYPHAPDPHNLMGIVLEKQENRLAAMKHFRAAWALDPTYLPCRVNLSRYGSFLNGGPCAFDEQDCLKKDKPL
ncbi:MAG: hypothetical protein ACOYI4_08300 [Christensenellales bacterium]|jgi:Flp pilus assembly protein TadD